MLPVEVPVGTDKTDKPEKRENWAHKTKGCSAVDFERVLQRNVLCATLKHKS